MSDNPGTQTPATDGDGEQRESNVVRDQREAIKRKDETIASQRRQLVGMHLQGIGLDAERGLGKAIAKDFDGEVTAEAVAAFAKDEYDYEKPAAQEPQQAQDAAAQQQQVEGFGSAAASMQPQNQEDIVGAWDQKLAQPDATRQVAQGALEAKVAAHPEIFNPSQ